MAMIIRPVWSYPHQQSSTEPRRRKHARCDDDHHYIMSIVIFHECDGYNEYDDHYGKS